MRNIFDELKVLFYCLYMIEYYYNDDSYYQELSKLCFEAITSIYSQGYMEIFSKELIESLSNIKQKSSENISTDELDKVHEIIFNMTNDLT